MTIIVIISYILSIFLARWFNYLMFITDKDLVPKPIIWFIPFVNIIMTFIFLISALLLEYIKFNWDWFNGKNW